MNIIGTLFFKFLKIGLFSIGGGYAIIPMIQEEVVEKSGWISAKTFADIITISQMTPGPLAVNTSTFVGLQLGGVGGAAAATVGCILCGVSLSLFLCWLFQKYKKSEYVFEILKGLKAASVGLIISAAAAILLLAFFQTGKGYSADTFDWTAFFIFAAALFALRKWKASPMLVMVVSGAAGLFFYM